MMVKELAKEMHVGSHAQWLTPPLKFLPRHPRMFLRTMAQDWLVRLRNARMALRPVRLEEVPGPTLQEVIYVLGKLADQPILVVSEDSEEITREITLYAREWRQVQRVVKGYWDRPGSQCERRV